MKGRHVTLTVHAYGSGPLYLFPLVGRRMGAYAEADEFGAFSAELLQHATSFSVHAAIATNGYNLGTHKALVALGGIDHEVEVTAFGAAVKFTVPTIELARATWNHHMAGVKQWLIDVSMPRPPGFRIRLYGEGAPFVLGTRDQYYREFGSFMEADAFIETCTPNVSLVRLCQVYSETPPNDFELGTDFSMGNLEFEITATGVSVIVTSTSPDVAREVWDRYWDELNAHLARLHDSQQT